MLISKHQNLFQNTMFISKHLINLFQNTMLISKHLIQNSMFISNLVHVPKHFFWVAFHNPVQLKFAQSKFHNILYISNQAGGTAMEQRKESNNYNAWLLNIWTIYDPVSCSTIMALNSANMTPQSNGCIVNEQFNAQGALIVYSSKVNFG